ncbi:MAG: NRDE family protein, partial [Bacteroidota bacterium]
EDHPQILGGRDLEAQGTWMAVDTAGRMGCVTNYRDLRVPLLPQAPSRGKLVPDFLTQNLPAETYLQQLENQADLFNGYNLLLRDSSGLFHYSNQEREINKLEPGIHGLSNHLMNTPWPKVTKLKSKIQALVEQASFSVDDWFLTLQDSDTAPRGELPSTGVPLEFEEALSAMFISIPQRNYGTRVSTLLLVDNGGKMYFEERAYVPSGLRKVFELNTLAST